MHAALIFQIKHDDFDFGETFPHGLPELFCIEIGQVSIKKEHLPKAILQIAEGLSASGGLFEAASGGPQTLKNALAHDGAGTGHQYVISIVRRDRKGRHTVD